MQIPHERIRNELAELVASWADEKGIDADISLSPIDRITFSFTDDNVERWDVRVSRGARASQD